MQADKIAIHVPNKWLSKAVQEYWMDRNEKTAVSNIGVETYGKRACLSVARGLCEYGSIESYKREGYTIITVDEFFKREAKKDKPSIRVFGYGKVKPDSFGFIVEDIHGSGCVSISWKEYDEIGKLRPREATDGE